MMTTKPPMVGKRFRPEIEFLIKLLQFKAAGGGDISGCTEHPEDMCYRNMYGPGKEPWKLFSGEHEIWELHDVSKRHIKEKYVLTDLTKIGRKNVSRTAGAGTWDDQNTSRPVEYGGQEMGYWKTLTYEYWGDDGADKCYYYMNELHLSEYALSQVKAKRNDYVICRVLKNESKCCRIRRGKKRVSQGQDDCPITNKKRKAETQASSSQVVPEEEPDDDDDDDLGACIDFADELCGLLQTEEVSSFDSDYPVMQGNCDPQVLSIPEYSGPVYVPEMFQVAQNQEQQTTESWDYAEMQPNWVPSCSNPTMPDQDSFADEWNFENLDEIMNFLNT